jgi:hypothetical protein
VRIVPKICPTRLLGQGAERFAGIRRPLLGGLVAHEQLGFCFVQLSGEFSRLVSSGGQLVADHDDGLDRRLSGFREDSFNDAADIDKTTAQAIAARVIYEPSQIGGIVDPAGGNQRPHAGFVFEAVVHQQDTDRPRREQVMHNGLDPVPGEVVIAFGSDGNNDASDTGRWAHELRLRTGG